MSYILVIIHQWSMFVLCNVADIDECAVDNGLCSDRCTNTYGSYVCSGEDGYQLLGSDKECSGK